MSCLNLANKLLPAKKAWKSFTNKLKSKVNKLQNSKPIKKITRRLITFRSIIKTRAALRHKPPSISYHHHQHQIYVDELFSETIKSVHAKKTVHHATKGETSMARETNDEKTMLYSVDDAWKAVVASSPQLRGVDERADEFIYKFREDIKLQKERSMLEFQEMLARSA